MKKMISFLCAIVVMGAGLLGAMERPAGADNTNDTKQEETSESKKWNYHTGLMWAIRALRRRDRLERQCLQEEQRHHSQDQ